MGGARLGDERADGHLTATLERREKRSLSARRERGRLVVERRRVGLHPFVAGANLHGNRSLSGGGQPGWGLEKHRYAVAGIESNQSSRGENGGMNLTRLHLLEPSRHVPTQLDNFEIRPQAKKL